ncbi:cyclase family protein [Alicycliphilus denitrificans]|uniref:Cyclase family protein n=1 Tax=Alicycliphilus denitrificans TaxID=179636 RepID=A0A3R7LG64_9BURK|nr:cyclase family protein [Alicycliphilus denitrificans]RKJ97459.1 cyclase family protein [Alicycliphilus denitrificans]
MRWRQRPEGSNWGDFGPDDQLGRANLIGPEQVRKGALEVREGVSLCLSLPLDYPGGNGLNPRRRPPVLRPTRRGDVPYVNFPLGHVYAGATDVISDDQVLLSLQYSTQWDSLAHVGALFDPEGDGRLRTVYYNGYRGHEHILGPQDHGLPARGEGGAPARYQPVCCEGRAPDESVARALGVEHLAVKGMQGRGVLVDLARAYGMDFRDIGYDELMRAMERSGATVEPGDMLLLRTGFAGLVLSMQRQPDEHRLHHSCAALDGGDEKLLAWITDSGIAALIADNYAVERHPPRRVPADGSPYPVLPLHEHCLFKLGLPLGELWYLEELAERLHASGRTRFLLTAPPLRLPGAAGSPVTPIATL